MEQGKSLQYSKMYVEEFKVARTNGLLWIPVVKIPTNTKSDKSQHLTIQPVPQSPFLFHFFKNIFQ